MDKDTLYRKKKRRGELFLTAAIYGASSLSVFLLVGIVGYVFSRGFRILSLRFFTSVTSLFRGTVGIAGNFINTLYIIGITFSIAVPVGIGAAVYLNEYARPGILTDMIVFAVETLAGIPSVIFGLFGMTFFGQTLGLGYSLLNGSLTLSLMVLPLIVKNTQEALRTVPEGYRDGALGMGAAKWHMIRTILLPSAMPGIWTGIVLAAGRVVGESAALIFTAGSARMLPALKADLGGRISGLWSKIFESGGTLAVEMYLQAQNGEYELAFGIGCVLIIVVFSINIILKIWIAIRDSEKCAGRQNISGGAESPLWRKSCVEKY